MNKLFFTISILFTIAAGLKSQNYVPFPIENANWNVFYVGTCQERAPDTLLLKYTINGDTTINELTYKKLCLENGDTINPQTKAIGGLREENRKIYYNGLTILSSTDDKEYLLYDFTKQIGDTILHNPQGWFKSVILDIDSVLIDGVYRKRYKVDNHWYYQNPDYIIEGIGSINNGLLGHISGIPTCGTHYWEHICFKENGVVKNLNPVFVDCRASNLILSSVITRTNSKIKIYPNPTDQYLHIENNSNENDLTITILDVSGRTISEKKIDARKTKMKLDIPLGIYCVQITTDNGERMLNEKIIKY